MASTESKLFNLLLRLINKKRYLRNQLASGRSSFFDCPEPTTKVKRTCHILRTQVNGRNIFTLTAKKKPRSDRHILYLHGGAYVQCFNLFHWSFLVELTESTGCTVTTPDYPLAPAYTYKDTLAIVSVLYKQILKTTDPPNFIVMGDSSGGGLALALAQKMRNEDIAQPGHIILLSPWLDVRLENPGINDIESRDPFLDRQSLQQAGRLYAGDTNLRHYLLSPINGSLDNLGQISIFIGSREILAPDARKLKELAAAKGIQFNYYEYKDMIHGWMFLNFPESKKARQQIADLVQH